jgi:hypothetical protein
MRTPAVDGLNVQAEDMDKKNLGNQYLFAAVAIVAILIPRTCPLRFL